METHASQDPAGIARRHGLPASQFRRDFFARGRPVVVSGWLDTWPARGRWTPEFFRDRFGGVEVDVERVGREDATELYFRGRAQVRMTLAELYRRLHATSEADALYYLGRWRILEALPALAAELGSLAPYYRLAWTPPAVTRRLTNGPIFWMGPKDSVTPLHFDSSPNLVAQLYGRKRWTLYPPAQGGNLHYPHRPFFEGVVKEGYFPFMSPVHFERPDPARYPRFAAAEGITFDVGPGDVLFVPPGYWHHVRSLEPAISLNYWRASAFTARYLTLYRYLRIRAALRSRSPLEPRR